MCTSVAVKVQTEVVILHTLDCGLAPLCKTICSVGRGSTNVQVDVHCSARLDDEFHFRPLQPAADIISFGSDAPQAKFYRIWSRTFLW